VYHPHRIATAFIPIRAATTPKKQIAAFHGLEAALTKRLSPDEVRLLIRLPLLHSPVSIAPELILGAKGTHAALARRHGAFWLVASNASDVVLCAVYCCLGKGGTIKKKALQYFARP